ncbi:MAG: HAD family hydrolase [Sporichthyaceae bacterium]
MNHPIEAVIFDWGGTLTRWRPMDIPATWHVVARTAHELGLLADRADLHALGADHRDGPVGALGDLLADLDETLWSRCRADCESTRFADVVLGCGLDPHEDLLTAHVGAWESASQLDPDVPAVLAGLRERGVKVGVLSNTIWPRAAHEAWFRRDGVLELIDGAVYSSEIAWTKPHPEAFRAAAAAVGTEPAGVLFVGDRPFEDIHGAARAGMRTALMPFTTIGDHERGPAQGEPDVVLRRLVDVLDFVDSLAEPAC